MTQVLNKHHYGGKVPPGAVDIMRGSEFGNPFAIGRHGTRGEVIAQYRKYLWRRIRQDKTFAAKVKDLNGKRLCCCCAPLACHGNVLAAAAEWLNQSAA